MSVPSFPEESFGAYDVPRARRPGGLTAVCVFAIILGGLGLLGSLVAIVSLAAGPRIQQALAPPPQGPQRDKLAEVQHTMQQRMQAVTDRYWWPNAGFALLNVGLAGGMLAGGIMALNRVARARSLLIIVFALAIPFEISRSTVNVFMQSEMAAVMSDLFPQMMQASGPAKAPNAEQAAAMGAAIAKMGVLAGIAFNLIYGVAKLTYYAVGWSYLCRPAVRNWLANVGEGSPAVDAA